MSRLSRLAWCSALVLFFIGIISVLAYTGTVVNAAPLHTPAAPGPDLVVTKTVQPALLAAGDVATYTVEFANLGTVTATNIFITDTLPVSLTVLTVVSTGVVVTDTATPLAWQVDDLPPGAGGMLTLTARVSATILGGQTLTNSVAITATTDDSLTNNVSLAALTTLDVRLEFTKTAGPNPAIAGLPMVYTLTVVNTGQHTATVVTLSDTLPFSATLMGTDQIDDDGGQLGFGGGEFSNTVWSNVAPYRSGADYLKLANLLIPTGVFTSRLIDASSHVSWTTFAWTPHRPTGKPLPDGGRREAGYPAGNADMSGNRVLLHFDEMTATTEFSNSAGVSITVLCGAECPTAGAAGRFHQAVSFTGTVSQSVQFSDTATASRLGLEFWVKPETLTNTILLTRWPVSGSAGLTHTIGITGGRFVQWLGGVSVTNSTVITPGRWYHLVSVAEAQGDFKLYVNGVVAAAPNGLGALWSGGSLYQLGAGYAGAIDEVAVYTRSLSAGEALEHYWRGALQLAFQVRACQNKQCPNVDFTGPGGLIDTYYTELDNLTLGTPTAVLTGLRRTRYFQYRVYLTTETPDASPELRSVRVGPGHDQITLDGSLGYCQATASNAFMCQIDEVPGQGGMVTVTAPVDLHPSLLGVITNSATLTLADGTLLSTSVTTTVIARSDLALEKFDYSDPVNLGGIVTYGINVFKFGPSTALSVTITDTVPGGITGTARSNRFTCVSGQTITCTTTSLLPGSYRDTIQITLTAPLTDGQITNTAGITSFVTPDPDTSNNSDRAFTRITALADVALEKAASGDLVDPGTAITYTIFITNYGPYTATNVTVLESAIFPVTNPAWTCVALTCTLQTPLAPDASVQLQLFTTAPPTGYLSNRASVSAKEYDPDLNNNDSSIYLAVRPVADLSVSKSGPQTPVNTGAPITYLIAITNTGPAYAGAITSTFTGDNPRSLNLPREGRSQPYGSGIRFRNILGVIQDMTVTVRNFSHSFPGDVTLLLVGPQGQTVVLMANALGGLDAVNADISFNDAGISLPISGTLAPTVYRPTNYGLGDDALPPAPTGPYGGSLSAFRNTDPNGRWQLYAYDILDPDGGDIADGWALTLTTRTTDSVTVSDVLPAGTTFVSASGTGLTCTSGATVTCDVLSLPVSQTLAFTLIATAPLTPGIITNTVNITSTTTDFVLINNTASITTVVASLSADVSIQKFASAAQVKPSDIVTYTILIQNAGPGLAQGLILTDLLPAQVTFITATTPLGWNCTLTQTIVCQGAVLTPNTSVAVTLTVQVNTGLTNGLLVVNSATVTALTPDPVLPNTAAVTSTVDTSAQVYLPLITLSTVDLTVERIVVAGGLPQVVIRNLGGLPIPVDFWVDLYLDPNPAPTGVNQTWADGRSTYGAVWGVEGAAIVALNTVRVFTLTVGDIYYWPTLSNLPTTVPTGTVLFAQVDSADVATTYGAVLEQHEEFNQAYNNILGPVVTNIPLTLPEWIEVRPITKPWPMRP